MRLEPSVPLRRRLAGGRAGTPANELSIRLSVRSVLSHTTGGTREWPHRVALRYGRRPLVRQHRAVEVLPEGGRPQRPRLQRRGDRIPAVSTGAGRSSRCAGVCAGLAPPPWACGRKECCGTESLALGALSGTAPPVPNTDGRAWVVGELGAGVGRFRAHPQPLWPYVCRTSRS